VGPTAAGKTAVALELAGRLGGELLGLDSMQVYFGLPVLTAAPDEAELARARHHLVGFLEPGQTLNVARFRQLALETAADVRARGRVPILVGGSGLYYSALVDGLSELPSGEPAVREGLLREAALHGPDWLHLELERLDPAAAARLHPNDEHRLVRALEVCRLTGRPYSEQLGRKQGLAAGSYRSFGLELPRDELYARIDRRTARMFEEGAIGEVAATLGLMGWPAAAQNPGRTGVGSSPGASPILKPGSSNPGPPALACGSGWPAGAGQAGPGRLGTARQMLGFRQLLPYLAGEAPRADALTLLARDTRHFARRQLKWFGGCPEVRWISAGGGRSPGAIAEEIAGLLREEAAGGAEGTTRPGSRATSAPGE
jgi:tRNA dimethylallyltransferase